MSDITITNKLEAVLDSRDVLAKLNEIRKTQGQVEKRHDNFLRDLGEEINKIRNEINSSNLSSTDYSDLPVNIQPALYANKQRSHVMMCEDAADMMLSKESPSVRLLMKRTLRELITKPKLPQTYVEALKALIVSEEEKQKALAQAEYQNQALVTSQTRNALKTKENKKLKAKLRGYSENYVSIRQYLSKEKIKLKTATNKLTTEVRKYAERINADFISQTLDNDKYSSYCFDLDFLDSIREDIVLCVELLNNEQKINHVFQTI